MTSTIVKRAMAEGLAGAIPRGGQTISAWAEEYRYVSAQRSARPGKWSNDVFPFLTGIMDAVTEPDVRKVVLQKSSQVGGPLALDTEIPTIDGWTTMGDIEIGDQVFDENGIPCKVLGVSEIFHDRCFEIEFSDHSKIVCDERHLWTVSDHKDTSKAVTRTITTKEMAATFRDIRWTRNRYSIPVCRPLKIDAEPLPLDPYLLGAWLGDGNASSNQITQSQEDAPEMAAQILAGGNRVEVRRLPSAVGNVVNLWINPKDSNPTHCKRGHEMTPANTNPVAKQCRKCSSQNTLHSRDGRARDPYVERPLTGHAQLKALDLIRNKHIPKIYLRASYSDRLSLLQGLMDTDGCIDRRGRCELSIANERLAKDAYELLMTLGIKCSVYISISDRGFSGGSRQSDPVNLYRLSFMVYDDKPVFRLSRKLAKIVSRQGRRPTETESRRIIAVREVSTVPTRCIAVDSASNLFLAGRSMIATHNTEMLINVLCYYIHRDPSLMMYVAEIEDKAKAWKQEALDPTIMESPEIRRCMIDVANGSQDNNQRVLRFRGGQLTIGWASSPAQLSSRPARIVCFDEVDAFEATKEGDAVKLAEARTKTFQESRKIILNSSPRDKETSVIEREYLAGDQRQFYVPCPICGHYQTLRWGGEDADFGVKFDREYPEDAYYMCEACHGCIEHEEKAEMLAHGIWRAAAGFKGTASFKISELYSPMTTWGDMAADFVEAKKHWDTLRVWTNTRLGETFAIEGEKIDYGHLQRNREDYPADVPMGVQFLTATADIQGDRIETEVRGWGRDRETWLIDYRVISGSPALPDVWNDLTDYWLNEWQGEDGQAYRIKAAGVDTGGHHTDEAYSFCKRNAGRRWFAFKGLSTRGSPIVSRPTRSNRAKVKLFGVGTDTAKDEIFALLKVEEPGPGYCHFPNAPFCDDNYFKMLGSERKVPRFHMGRQYFVYEKVSANARNEGLDLWVYNIAVREILVPSYRKPKRRGLPPEPVVPDENATPESPDTPPSEPPTNVVPIRRRRRGFNMQSPFKGYKV